MGKGRAKYKKVISASRRVDLLTFYPDFMLKKLEEIGEENIHTLVIWTKNPENMLAHARLRKFLKRLNQIYVLLTITGLGGTPLEQKAPTSEEVFQQLPRIIDFLGSPKRVAIRYDPLIDVIYQDRIHISNMNMHTFQNILNQAQNLGIERVIVSYVTLYPKVETRLKRNGFRIIEHPVDQITDFIKNRMMPQTRKLGMELSTCVLPDLTTRGCIDAETLIGLHPLQEQCSLAKDTSQRETCHCTKSFDIGQWFACFHNCLYCYGNPAGRKTKE